MTKIQPENLTDFSIWRTRGLRQRCIFPVISLDWSKPAKPVPNLFEFPTILCALDLVRTEELELPSEKYCLHIH